MNKKLKEFAEQKRFTVEKRFVYGMADDVYVTITPVGNQLQLYFSMSCAVAKAEAPIRQALRSVKGVKRPVIKQKSEAIHVTLAVTNRIFDYETLNTVITTVISVAKQANVEPNMNCVHCGKATCDIAVFNEVACPVCSSCVREIEEANDTYTFSPLSVIMGIIGAILGAVIGAVPWVLVYLYGWIVSILAFLIGLCSFFGYKLFRGPRRRGVALSTIYIVSILTVVAFYFVYAFVILSINGVFPSLSNIFYILGDASVLVEIGLALLLSILGIVGINKRVYTYTLPKNARFVTRRSPVSNYREIDGQTDARPGAGGDL